ncbi:MAG: glycosyltransferase family 87 protein [Candidatus Dormibacterales bacterium]
MSAPATRPPLWLAAAATASFWGVVLGLVRQIRVFVNDPTDNDFSVYYAAAKVGLGSGWSHIYDAKELHAASSTFPGQVRAYDSYYYYLHPPLLAWIVTPLTALSEPQAFVIWTVVGAAAFVAAWAIACPFDGLARITMLLLGLALWSVEESLRFGQPTLILLALIALSWQQAKRDRAVFAGALLALAVMVKPQDVILVPIALLVSGRTRIFFWFLGWAAALTLAFVLNLGSMGLNGFVSANLLYQSNTGNQYDTMAFIFGIGPIANAVELGLAVFAIAAAYLRRREIDTVFAIGLLGSIMASPHLHESDYALDVLAAWLVLRSRPSAAHKLWLALGIPAGQFIAIGLPLPQLLWQPGWLVVLAREAVSGPHPEVAPAVQGP